MFIQSEAQKELPSLESTHKSPPSKKRRGLQGSEPKLSPLTLSQRENEIRTQYFRHKYRKDISVNLGLGGFMRCPIIALSLILMGTSVHAATYNCKMNELFPRKLPAHVVLKTVGNIATLESSTLGSCVSFKKMKSWSSDSEYVGITAAVNCDVGMINLLFDPLKSSTINLSLSGTKDTHYEVGRANYICTQEI